MVPSFVPHVKTSQPNQTRRRKKGARSTQVPRHKTRGILHNSTHPFEGQTGSPSVPRSAPKETSPPISRGSPARLFPNGVLYASSHSPHTSDRSHPAHNPPASPPENPRTP